MNYIRVTNENKAEFDSVLPGIFCDGRGISLAAYEDDGTVCGAVSVSYSGYEYKVEWLYVSPEKRLGKVGTGLIKEVFSMVNSLGICPIRAEFDVDDESGLYDFFLAISTPDLVVDVNYAYDRYVVTTEDFTGAEILKKKVEMDYAPEYLFDMPEELRNKALDKAMDHLTISSPEDFEATCEKKLCFVVEREKDILSLMIVQKDAAGDLHLSYLYSLEGKALMSILVPAAKEVKKNYKGRRIYFDAVTDESALLAKKFFPNAKKRLIYEAEF